MNPKVGFILYRPAARFPPACIGQLIQVAREGLAPRMICMKELWFRRKLSLTQTRCASLESPRLLNSAVYIKLFFLLLSLPLLGVINQNNDLQVWVTEEVDVQIAPVASVSVANEWRIGDDVSKLYFFYLQGILKLEVQPWFQLGPGYRHIWALRGNRWRMTFEPLVDSVFHKTKGDWKFQIRHRISYLDNEKAQNLWQYRGRVRCECLWKTARGTIGSYLSNEAFVLSHIGFSQDRVMAGAIVPLFGPVKGNFYYMLRFLRQETWTHQHVFGSWFTIEF